MTEVVASGEGADGGVLEILGGAGNAEGVKVRGVDQSESGGGETFGEAAGMAVDAEGNFFQAFGSVKESVHGSEDGEEDLGGADVAGGAVAADVLFPGLEGQAVGGSAAGILGNADKSAGKKALIG